MKYKHILITGGAGFVGSNLALKLKAKYPKSNVCVIDNLKRRGSELNLSRLSQAGVSFIHGDVRAKDDLIIPIKVDLIIECSAEPSVLAGTTGSPDYLINTNLMGALNCLELARKDKADFIFLSTSRIYPIEYLEQQKFTETPTRFQLSTKQTILGASQYGVSENFPVDKSRSLYGTTKLAAELFLQEYITAYGINGIINRCGVITGPWQFGKVDQGVIVYWLASHYFKKELSYIGYGGTGKQVRDFMHIDDLFDAIDIQINDFKTYNNQIFNIGGGVTNSVSLLELTQKCQAITGHKVKINHIKTNRANDVRIYVSDARKFEKISRWQTKINADQTLQSIFDWMLLHETALKSVLT